MLKPADRRSVSNDGRTARVVIHQCCSEVGSFAMEAERTPWSTVSGEKVMSLRSEGCGGYGAADMVVNWEGSVARTREKVVEKRRGGWGKDAQGAES